MKAFHLKLLLIQTVFYGLLYVQCYTEGITLDAKIIWRPMVIGFYSVSVTLTFIIPMIKLYFKK